MSEIAIVVIGFNRIYSLKRTLSSLKNAEYFGDKVDLIISIDYSGKKEIIEYVENFKWEVGEKKLRIFNTRQGLRKHILSCGDFLKEYEALVILEDDIFVSPGFYSYAREAVYYYKGNLDIAGISLYSITVNQTCNTPFIPCKSNYDTYFIQYAQSWGQIWLRDQWYDFMNWYKKNSNKEITSENVPTNVLSWKDTSWLKYHIKYCIEKNKYFVYPYHSLSTCFSETGEHTNERRSFVQSPLLIDVKVDYNFAPFDRNSIKYDAYLESQTLYRVLKIDPKELCVDLYGTKQNIEKHRYILTTKHLNYKIIRSFGLDMYPHDANVYFENEGKDIYLYDTSYKENNKSFSKDFVSRNTIYYFRLYNLGNRLHKVFLYKLKRKLKLLLSSLR